MLIYILYADLNRHGSFELKPRARIAMTHPVRVHVSAIASHMQSRTARVTKYIARLVSMYSATPTPLLTSQIITSASLCTCLSNIMASGPSPDANPYLDPQNAAFEAAVARLLRGKEFADLLIRDARAVIHELSTPT